MIKVVGFDLDGTIADTIPVSVKTMKKAASRYTEKPVVDEDVYATFGMNEEGMMKALVGEHWGQALALFYDLFRVALEEEVVAFNGVVELIRSLRAKGMPVVLITGRGEKSCMVTLESLGIANLFDSIWTGGEHGNIKSEQLKEAADIYRVRSEDIAYIGDAVADVRSCKEAGVKCLSVAWYQGHEHDELMVVSGGRVFTEVEELADCVIHFQA